MLSRQGKLGSCGTYPTRYGHARCGAGRRFETGQDFQQGGFAGPVRADQADVVTFAQGQSEIAKQGSHPKLLLIDSNSIECSGPYPDTSRDSESVQYTVRGLVWG